MSIFDIPTEILHEIMSYLTFQGDYLSLAETSPYFYRCSQKYLQLNRAPYIRHIMGGDVEFDAILVKGISSHPDYLYHGKLTQYAAGVRKMELQFKYGLREGPQRDYYPDGTLLHESFWRDGVAHGPFRIYNPDGSLRAEAFFENGKLHGTFKILEKPEGACPIEINYVRRQGLPNSVEAVFSHDELISMKTTQHIYNMPSFMMNFGEIATRQVPEKIATSTNVYNYKNDLLEGPHVLTLYSAHYRVHCNYMRGNLHGPFRVFTLEGTPIYECTFRDGIQEGIARRYYPNGKLMGECLFVGGRSSNQYTNYHANGNVAHDSQWLKDGQRLAIYYLDGGKLLEFEEMAGDISHKIYYKDGSLASEFSKVGENIIKHRYPADDSPECKKLTDQCKRLLAHSFQSASSFIPDSPPALLPVLQSLLQTLLNEAFSTVRNSFASRDLINKSMTSETELEAERRMWDQMRNGDHDMFGMYDIDNMPAVGPAIMGNNLNVVEDLEGFADFLPRRIVFGGWNNIPEL
ncbi:Phophatidylinositol-4-phosphate 5-kinase [Kaumoebavirus]|uniref:Phophatidylinositol-4-phosphate 5-kinase n=1 Tax=Kaumoebavirus TaxID=1859492 RepID=UPI0009C29B9D|nr:Phophatidylinositol-4-phosphate 5-kinase [Kaumoebavirus]ARA71885.1 Phophatidylinositol-4-phosphate 5-kinase [Kaumoebavirus]